jgi:dienelactone hydrolase
MKGTGWILTSIMICAIAAYAQDTNKEREGRAPMKDRTSLHVETVEYQSGNISLKGYLVYSDTLQDAQPGVLVVHEWWGLNDYPKSRAEELARLGYVALAVDMYGNGTNTTSQDEAKLLSGALREDRAMMRERITAALDILKKNPRVDPQRIAAIGYCFGGTVVLELARSGADVAGVVSFHGNLDTPMPSASTNIQASILVLHGADDPMVPMQQVLSFQSEMREAGADWQMNIYGDAVHSFSNPKNGPDKSKGVAYNEKAARRSWDAMKLFFTEIFGRPQALVSAGELAGK